jgi:hypothetical protein
MANALTVIGIWLVSFLAGIGLGHVVQEVYFATRK